MHQYLFYIGDFPIRSYGIVISLSILLATGVGYFLAKADGRGYEKYIPDLGIYCGIAGLLGARLWDVFFFDWDYYQHHLTEILNVWQGGMAIQGGVFLGVLVGILYSRKHKLDTVPPLSSDRRSAAARTFSTAMHSVHRPAAASAFSIRRAPSPTTPTVHSRSGRRRSGRGSWILSSSLSFSSSVRAGMHAVNASLSTSCCTASCALPSSICAATTQRNISVSLQVPR